MIETLAELGRKIETARAEMTGERREVAVLFADLCGYTSISEKLDPEEIGLLVNRLLQELAQSVQRFEGHVDKFIGDAVMALFGAPKAHEDDPDRSVLAALDMLEVMRRHAAATDSPLQLRIGINLGEVVAGTVGSGQGVQYTVMGDAVNVASRLEHQAVPNTILVSESLARRLSPRFEVERLEAVELRGRSEPIQTYRVEGFRAGGPAAVEPRAPFVGREAELATLEAFFARVSAGRGGALLLEAEPGTGKSRLVREALARSGGAALVLETGFSAVRLPGQRPALAELFRQVIPEDPAGGSAAERALFLLGGEAESYRSGIEGLAREADPSSGDRAAAAQASAARQDRWSSLAALLRRAAAARPVLVWIEDIHWIDETTQEFLDFLVPRLPEQAIGLLLTSRMRPAEAWLPDRAERVTLQPLDATASERLLISLLGETESAARRELIGRSAGNPFFLEELARAVQESVAAGRPLATLPSSLQGLLVSRIDRLPAAAKLLIQMASVLGERFPTRLLERIYRLEPGSLDFDAALRLLEDGGFLEVEINGDVRHRFHHALVQEAAYGGLLLRIRKLLHESAAKLGEEYYGDRAAAEAPFFAHHYWEAGLATAAAPHLWAAGRQAADRYELAAAERFLARARDVLREHPEVLAEVETRAGFREVFGTVLLHRGQLDEAEEEFQALQELGAEARRAEWRARGLEHRGRIAWYRGRLDDAQSLFERALAELPEPVGRIAADLHNDLGIVFYYRGDADTAFDHHRLGLSLREELGDRLGLAKSLCNIGNVLFDLRDDLDGARDHYRKALAHARAIGDRLMTFSVIKNLGGVATEAGDWQGALALFDEAARIQDDIGWSFGAYVTLQSRVVCEIALGRIADALRHLDACLREGDAYLEPLNRVRTRLLLFDAHLRSLRDDLAASALREAAELAAELGVADAKEDDLRLREGRLCAAAGDWEGAARAFAAAEEAARRLNHAPLARLAAAHRGRAERRLGRPSGAPAAPPPEAGPRPLHALEGYLAADAALAFTAEQADRLRRAGERAAELGELALARSAFEREAEARAALGDASAGSAALERARDALRALEQALPADSRPVFLAHPRNERLRRSAPE